MEAITDPDRRARLLKLEERVFNPRDILNADCLLVSLYNVFLIHFSVVWFK
jgi:hypothetical protein